MHRIVIKRDGREEKFRTQQIMNAIFEIIKGLDFEDDYEIVFRITKELDLKVPERVTSEELDTLVLKAIENLIPKHPVYDILATKQLLKLINKSINRKLSSFKEYIRYGKQSNLLNADLSNFNIGELERQLDYTNDLELDYFGLTTLKDRYLLKDRELNTIEKPQWFFMRVAMGIGNNEKEIIDIYKKLSSLEYLHSTPTLFNSGTPISQFSSCYVNVVDDSLESITGKLQETAFLAKYAGGVGTDVSRVRATGSMIHSLNAKSSGVIPFIKVFDTMVNSIQQGGRRRSSQVMSIQPWHLDIEAFIDLRETTGNSYFRTPSLNTKLWMPDEMMRRIENNKELYLFDPGECPELVEAWGDDFAIKYNERIKQAKAGKLKQYKVLNSRDFFNRYLFKLAKTGHPWLTFKDEHNRHNPCKEYSVVNSSNLCTEISIPNHSQSTAVCTLASINLSKHINKEKSDLDWGKFAETIKVIVKALDNALDKNFYPSETSRKNTMELRPLGIGLMGLAEAFISLGLAYDSEEAILLAGKIGQFMKKTAYATSEQLANEKGAFKHYTEMQQQGKPYSYKARRNAVLLAVAPTATISIIAGTTSSIDSYFSNVYSRDTLSGKFMVINKQLIKALEEKGMWNDEMADLIKTNNGSVQLITQLDKVIDKALFKTAFEIHPKQQIKIAAAFQASVDQAVSKSLYIDEQLRDQMPEIYIDSWKSKLKSTYYCFIDKVNKGEKYTSNVNKRGSRKGFGASGLKNDKQSQSLEEIEKKAREKHGDDVVDEIKKGNVDLCPTDPLLAKICPSCE